MQLVSICQQLLPCYGVVIDEGWSGWQDVVVVEKKSCFWIQSLPIGLVANQVYGDQRAWGGRTFAGSIVLNMVP